MVRRNPIRNASSVRSARSHLREAVLLLLLTILVLSLFTFYVPQSLPGPNFSSKTVTILKGMTVRSIGRTLKEKGIISGVPQFVLAAKLWGKEGSLQAGRYSFPAQNSLFSVLKRLTRGEIQYEQVTIPEGLTVHGVAHRLQTEAAVDSQKFIHLVNDTPFISSLGIEAESLEGYLFPSTYTVHWEMDAAELIRQMVGTFKRVYDKSCEMRAQELGFSLQEILTLASIIEKEVKVAEERPAISAVFHNRLKLGRALESCATVEYALGVHKPRLSEEDLQVQSPYNTYLHTGLPPAPICSPGKASIEAALYPADVDYLYFVSAGNGHHIFSRTLEEHARAKRRVKRANGGR